jgi:hypothetical protein
MKEEMEFYQCQAAEALKQKHKLKDQLEKL